MKGSWGIVMMRERIVSRGIRERLRESMVMVPESRSRIRRRTERSDDLPLYLLEDIRTNGRKDSRAHLPVRPQMPILEPAVILKDTFLKAGESGL